MAWQGLKLNLRVQQKQILTPGLCRCQRAGAEPPGTSRDDQRGDDREPRSGELSEEPTVSDNYSDETFLKAETEKVPEKEVANPFDEFDVGAFFNSTWIPGETAASRRSARFQSALV